MPELILAKLDHISMILKLNSNFREVQRILTHFRWVYEGLQWIFFLTDFKLQLRICTQSSQHRSDYGIITAHSPGMTVWRKPYFSGVGYQVDPSRICILIGIIWLNGKFFLHFLEKNCCMIWHIPPSSPIFFSLSIGLFSNLLFYSIATYFCISAHPLLTFLSLYL